MGLESGTYISDLVASNPLGSDNKAQGDDHIRLIKTVIKNTFPNISGPVTLTQDQINALTASGNDDFIETGQIIPNGIIVAWAGAVASIPAGWKLCDGTNGTPNLADKFIVGAVASTGGLGGIGASGGTNSPHTHAMTVSATTLTESQIPSHSHTLFADELGNNTFLTTSAQYVKKGGILGGDEHYIMEGTNNIANVGRTKTTGGGGSHTHTASAASSAHLPSYYQLAFIMKG